MGNTWSKDKSSDSTWVVRYCRKDSFFPRWVELLRINTTDKEYVNSIVARLEEGNVEYKYEAEEVE
jgi:hypothetical protein